MTDEYDGNKNAEDIWAIFLIGSVIFGAAILAAKFFFSTGVEGVLL